MQLACFLQLQVALNMLYIASVEMLNSNRLRMMNTYEDVAELDKEEHRWNAMDSFTIRSLDRISTLPDSILCHILSFLPMKYAVRTSTLSTRYQYLWTYITSLHFDNSELFTNDIGEAEADLSFRNFVSTVLLLSNVSCLEKFSLKLESFCNIGIVKSWISIAIKRNVQKLELGYSQLCAEIPIQLPQTMFICKTLVDLMLKGKVSLQIPASVWLPSLKILKMEDIIYENGDSAQKLIHGCPVLEYMDFYREDAKSGEVFNISVPTLKRLEVTCLGPGEQLVFNTPTLEYLDLTYYWAEGFSLVNLSSCWKHASILICPAQDPSIQPTY
ncbi:putative F-box/LRR-repeat protein At4g15060 [Rhododendron vialii]|uniref:putative F-box/LRR-repeat protein At4g15060 n=1 Tax=Rhododendron vialii TaxID=182163 RepID=UPI00265F69A5|nr:putative F-box/LRR-repeat protein At4g15060 [Rhododendron vialii]